jgi:RNA polymerase sigma-70 factor (ECF subfamily)
MEGQEQFTRLWTEAQPKLAGYINALVPDFQEVEDILQDVAVVLLKKFPEYDPQRPFIGWSIGVARREVLMSRRRHARSFLCYQTELLEQIGQAYEELAPELDERARALKECLKAVQGRASELLQLRYEQSLKPNAISRRLGLAAVAVRVMLSRTRASLRQCIERKIHSQELVL